MNAEGDSRFAFSASIASPRFAWLLALVAALPRCAVSPTSRRQTVRPARGLRIGNPRYSRLETCATDRESHSLNTYGQKPGLAKAKAWLLRLFLSLWVGFQVQAADPSETFDQANKLYEEGKYAEAAGAYEKMIQEGNASAALYFNLGNTCFKNGQIGRAIVNYRLAKRLAPRDPDVRANLQFARDSVSSGSSATNRWLQRWLGLMTLNELTVLAGVAIWFWFLLLVLGEMRVELKKSLQGYTATVGVISGLLALWLGVAAERRFHQTQAVIIVREAVVRYGPLEESQSFYTLRDGAEMAVLDRKDGWLQVIDAAKRTGWVQARQVASLSAD